MIDNKCAESSGVEDYRQLLRKRADELAELLCQSHEYHQFMEARQILEADADNSYVLNELRQQQMNLRMAAMLGEDVTEDSREFERMFLSLSQDPNVSNYLFAEGRFFRLISEVEDAFAQRLGLMRYFDENAARNTDIHLN
ncbi:MAG: YlbF family regulator [Firmicutes bacterium]|nr:YlbF family regulator [Bacillota bacterium]